MAQNAGAEMEIEEDAEAVVVALGPVGRTFEWIATAFERIVMAVVYVLWHGFLAALSVLFFGGSLYLFIKTVKFIWYM